LIALFLAYVEEKQRREHDPHLWPGYKRQQTRKRDLGTYFGKVAYWRTYLYHTKSKKGHFPLDVSLGLAADGFSMLIRSLGARVATQMSYGQAVCQLTLFMGWSPCQRTLEQFVLGLGRQSGDWFEAAPAPENDGEVLVVQIDSKGIPTATEGELKKRRRKRRKSKYPGSKRHHRWSARQQLGPKKRKNPSDHSKNAKMATIVVIYSLRMAQDDQLEGPINKKVYASFAPKRHAFAIARREADKRGFTQESGKLIQVVTDGDNDLERYCKEFFPHATHTLDIFHATEYLWKAAGFLFLQGSFDLENWVAIQKDLLFEDEAPKVLAEIQDQLEKLPKRGSRSKWRRKELGKIINYFRKRLDLMKYKSYLAKDLEVASGAVEGAVNYVIGRRLDCGGMRWIKERAEALLQLRCIEVNGDWDAFMEFVHERSYQKALANKKTHFLKAVSPSPLPTYGTPTHSSPKSEPIAS